MRGLVQGFFRKPKRISGVYQAVLRHIVRSCLLNVSLHSHFRAVRCTVADQCIFDQDINILRVQFQSNIAEWNGIKLSGGTVQTQYTRYKREIKTVLGQESLG